MKHILAFSFFAVAIVAIGCGEPQATSIVENADQNAIAEYEAMVMSDAAAMNADMDANPEGTNGKAAAPSAE